MLRLFKPDMTMLVGLVVGVYVIPWMLAEVRKKK